MPPDFADVEYWNARFQTEFEPFEWLKSPNELLPHIKACLKLVPEEDQNILHIGPGSSTLSLRLRDLVSDPQKIHNIDYSQYAIDMGKQLEQKVFPDAAQGSMQWTCLDLRDPEAITKLTHDDLFEPKYSLIVDKCVADALACGPDVSLHPRTFRTASWEMLLGNGDDNVLPEARKVHPINLLMLHLAVIASPNARWVCCSYSSERFQAIDSDLDKQRELRELLPFRYWALEDAIPLQAQVEEDDHSETEAPVHRPQITYWLYMLRRTKEKLALLPVKG